MLSSICYLNTPLSSAPIGEIGVFYIGKLECLRIAKNRQSVSTFHFWDYLKASISLAVISSDQKLFVSFTLAEHMYHIMSISYSEKGAFLVCCDHDIFYSMIAFIHSKAVIKQFI